MAPHSSTLAWKIPWMEEPGRLQDQVQFFFLFLFLAALGLRCCTQAFSGHGRGYSLSQEGLLFVAVSRLLTAMVSLVVEHGPQALRLSSQGRWS